jgi:lipoprotein-anchoring transpeptidase ErfK/SrfK
MTSLSLIPIFVTLLFISVYILNPKEAFSNTQNYGAKEFLYVKIADSCDYKYEGKDCVEAYNEPRSGVPPVARFREGIVLRIKGQISYDDMTWYKVSFADQKLHRPERLINDWYVRGEDVEVFYGKGERSITTHGATLTQKRIVVDLSDQKMYAYDGETLFMEVSVSTGRELSQTPLGEHKVFQKMPSRYMQGPNPGVSAFYDLPGVPWNLYFTPQGDVIHGAYWHDSFGTPYSFGCVNLHTEQAKKLYDWTPLGTKVLVQE